MKKASTYLTASICLAACLIAAELRAATLFDMDDVVLAGGSNPNTFALAQATNGGAAGTLTKSGSDLSFAVSTNTSGNVQSYVVSYFNSHTLVNVGDKITLSYNASLSAIPSASQATPFRVGLFNSGGTKITANSYSSAQNAAFSDDTGYSSYYRTASGNASGQLTELATGTGSRTIFPGTPTAIPESPTNSALGLTANTPFSGTFSLELTAFGVLVTSSVNVGGTIYTSSVTDLTGVYTTFDTLGIFANSAASTPTTFTILDMAVTAVPEPGVEWLVIAGCGFLILRLRQRSRSLDSRKS